MSTDFRVGLCSKLLQNYGGFSMPFCLKCQNMQHRFQEKCHLAPCFVEGKGV